MADAPVIATLSPSQERPVKAWAATSAPWAARTQFPFCDGQRRRASTLAIRSTMNSAQRCVTDPCCSQCSLSRIVMKIRRNPVATGFLAQLSAVRRRERSLADFVAAGM
jgi:hypothetical protein